MNDHNMIRGLKKGQKETEFKKQASVLWVRRVLQSDATEEHHPSKDFSNFNTKSKCHGFKSLV